MRRKTVKLAPLYREARRGRMPSLYQIVEVVDLAPFSPGDDAEEALKFRIEILRERKAKGLYCARVWRRETFRIKPSFGRARKESWDEEILIRDIVLAHYDEIQARTAKAVLQKVLQEIRDVFQLRSRRPSARKR